MFDYDRGNIPYELLGMKFPSTLDGAWGKARLGSTIFRLKNGMDSYEPYATGKLVRLISGNPLDGSYYQTPGFHNNDDYVVVCRLEATHAEGLGVKKTDLEFVSNIPIQTLGGRIRSFFQRNT